MKHLFGALTTVVLWLSLPTGASAEGLVDPTRPHNAARVGYDAAPRGPVVQSIMVSPTLKSAVISGKRVGIGDVYDGAVITAITPYEVRMTKAGRESSLRLQPKVAKQKGIVQ